MMNDMEQKFLMPALCISMVLLLLISPVNAAKHRAYNCRSLIDLPYRSTTPCTVYTRWERSR